MAKRIVIADDSVTIQRAFAMTFTGEDVTLMSARSADEGLAMARQIQADLVIADGVMPGRSGYELCAAIKTDPSLAHTAVYILASSHQPYDDARGRQSGADGHLLKPFETNALIEKVRDALARGPSPDARPTAPTAAYRPSAPAVPVPPPSRPSVVQMSTVSLNDDDEYGELTVDISPQEPPRPEVVSPAAMATPVRAPAHAPPAPPPAAAAASSTSTSSVGMRPSLIPGLRPGAVPLARPGTQPVRTLGPGAAPPSRPPAPVSRTLVGLPAANLPIPGTSRYPSGPGARPAPSAPSAPARPTAPTSPSPSQTVTPTAPPSSATPLSNATPLSAGSSPGSLFGAPTASAARSASQAAVSSLVDQKVAAIAAKGPEYEALAKLSREIIEQIVWEIVPELAEAIIREHVDKRGV